MNTATAALAFPLLEPLKGGYLDWTIFLVIAAIWGVIFFLFRRSSRANLRRRSRELAEKLVTALPSSIQCNPKMAGAVPQLNQAELQRITSEVEAFGFVQAGDYGIYFDNQESQRGFFRLFYHPEKHCFADTGVTGKALASEDQTFLFGISSSLENDWGIHTANSAPAVIKYYWRLPKLLKVLKPRASFEELLHTHMDLRSRVVRDLELRLSADSSVEHFFRRVENTRLLRRETLLNRDVIGEYREAKRVQEEGEWEWLGDYPEEAARRARGKKLRPLMELSPTYSLPQDDALEQMQKIEGNAANEELEE